MKGQGESLYFAFALAFFLFAVVLFLNLIEPTAIPVSEDQYSKIRDTHLIDALVICPTGTYWQLKQSVRIQREGEVSNFCQLHTRRANRLRAKARPRPKRRRKIERQT